MKTLKTCLLLLAVCAFVACEKQTPLTNDPTSTNVDHNEDIQLVQASAGVKVECNSSCTQSQEECRINGTYSGGTHTLTCSCEGCTMVITNGIAPMMDQELLAHVEHVEANYHDYLNQNYGSDEITTHAVEVVNFEDEFVYIQFDYTNQTQGEESSVAYKVTFDQAAAVANKFEIDCSGGCTDENSTCRENFNVNTGSASCTCEGSCTMTVTQLPASQ